MSLAKNRWFRRIGFAVVAIAALGTGAVMSSPAQAFEHRDRAPVATSWHRDRAHSVTSWHRASHFPRFFYGFGHHWHPRHHYSR
jgi:hypothetical protein